MKLSIPMENIPALLRKMEELNKRATRLGILCPEIIFGEKYEVRHKPTVFGTPPVSRWFQRVELLGEGIDKPISYGTHQIVGVFNHEYTRVLYNSFSPSVKIDADYKQRFKERNVSHCEHCNKTIKRNNTYLIASEDGKQMLVGSSCMKAFIPLGKDVGSIVSYYTNLPDTLDEFFDEDYNSEAGWGENRFVSLSYYLFWVYLVRVHTAQTHTDKEGFRNTLYSLRDGNSLTRFSDMGITREDIEESKGKVPQIIEWWRMKDHTLLNDFDEKIQTLCLSDEIRVRDEGIAAWAVHSYIQQTAPVTVDGSNEFVGEVGERLNDIEVTFKREQFLYQNEYGVSILYIFKTKNGDTIVWKTTPRIFDIGYKLIMSARVKEHIEYNGVKQTSVTRPTFRNIL